MQYNHQELPFIVSKKSRWLEVGLLVILVYPHRECAHSIKRIMKHFRYSNHGMATHFWQHLPATDMFLSTISLIRLLIKVCNIWNALYWESGMVFGLSSGLIIMTSTRVAAIRDWRVDCLINSIKQGHSQFSSSTVHPRVYIAWRVDFPSRTLEEYRPGHQLKLLHNLQTQQ